MAETIWRLVRPLLFRGDPEQAHGRAIAWARLGGASAVGRAAIRTVFGETAGTSTVAFGLRFPNRVGLAAGYDKDGLGLRGLAALGFGHIEIGTVTPRPQPGNERPRVFRLVEDEALINRMGFPSRGADFVASRLIAGRPEGAIVGVNLGKNRDTPLAEAGADYVEVLETLAAHADYATINVSSPNTPGLRRLQAGAALAGLLAQVVRRRDELVQDLGRGLPLLVKLAPDLSDGDLEDAVAAVLGSGVDGIIATNTTLSREGLRGAAATEAGGMSGAPLRKKSLAMVGQIATLVDGQLPVVAVGGIHSADDARACVDAGASLVQLYTGLVYRGPGLVREVAAGLAAV